jgi:UDP-3-O-[3-hydroxymyristoyl] N-acetylglucosamine deacetylase/3-hydroxyacyl-[acyl-carrier-protein] dehydratase
VIPGDTVIFKLDLSAPIRRGIVQMRGTAYVNGQVVSEGDLMAQIIKDKA